MNELTIYLSEDEIGMIGNELNKLFLFQDRPFSKEKQSAFLEEIRGWGIPFNAIVSGIRKLKAEDLKSLKLAAIRDAASQFFFHGEENEKCSECLSGIILMRDEKNYQFSLACRCQRGNTKKMNLGLVGWNGEETQFSKNRLLVRS